MLMQLEMLPDWTTYAAQRVGSSNGPTAPEYELTEDELDWSVRFPSRSRRNGTDEDFLT
jgi:hypothetical protein